MEKIIPANIVIPTESLLAAPGPKLIIKGKPKSIFDYSYEDFEFVDYIHDEPIKAPVAI